MKPRKKHLTLKGLQIPPVHSKLEFINRFLEGEFGNRTETWTSPDSYKKSGYASLVCLRSKVPGGLCLYDLEPKAALIHWEIFGQSHYLSAMAPNHLTTFQGEVVQALKSLDLQFSTAKLPMREALAFSSENVHGAVASLLLQYYLNPQSMDWLNHLLDTYPGHAIEFSCFSVNLGILPGFNTLFWEVRRY